MAISTRFIQFTGKEQLEVATGEIGAPGPGQLLIETTRSLISTGTESICYQRNFDPGTHWDDWVKYPFRSGYLAAGRVLAVGEGVAGWSEGDRVAMRRGHASHHHLNAADACRIPENVSDEAAAWMGLGKITQVGVRMAQHRLGDAVVLVGLGLLGQLVAQYLHLSGARQIIAIDPWQPRLDFLAQTVPTAQCLNMGAEEAAEEVQRLTEGERADVVYDITGHHAVFPHTHPLVRDHGTVVLLGDTGKPNLQTLTRDVINRGLHIVGAHDRHAPGPHHPHGKWTPTAMHRLFLHYLATGQIQVESLITHRYAPDQAKDAFTMLQTERDTAMGVIFDWS